MRLTSWKLIFPSSTTNWRYSYSEAYGGHFSLRPPQETKTAAFHKALYTARDTKYRLNVIRPYGPPETSGEIRQG